MTPPTLRSAEDNYAAKRRLLNGALRTPTRHGGEEGLRRLITELAYLECAEERGYSLATVRRLEGSGC